jgi:L-fuculose-phosphate aldolase
MNEDFARRQLTDICQLLYDRNLTVSAGGNMSIRLNDKEFLITPSGRNKGMLEPEDMVLMNVSGKLLSDGKPSIESRFHLGLYKANPDTGAVVHCHPLNCVLLAVKEQPVRSGLTPEGVLLLGDVPLIEYQTPGSKKLVDAVMRHSDAKAMILIRHGALTQGRDLEEAFNRMEELEFQAKIQLLAGDVKDLPAAEIRKLRKL